MQVVNDWTAHKRDGRVSWIHAFDDPRNYGPSSTRTRKTYEYVLHQMRDPPRGITSMCTEPSQTTMMQQFLKRHLNFTIFDVGPNHKPHIALEWWVGWHTFLTDLKIPVYQIEKVKAKDIFRMAGLEHVYRANQTRVPSSITNGRKHRKPFTWQELFTIDPVFALKAWKLAHLYGYEYPDVDFDSLTCLPKLPLCSIDSNGTAQQGGASPNCPAGTHPVEKVGNISVSRVENGWVSWGCREHKRANGTFVGLSGVSVGGNGTTRAVPESNSNDKVTDTLI